MPLLLVGTPLGNLKDMSKRCAEALEEADIIYCEDTRVSGKLLASLGLKKKLASYHEHSPIHLIRQIEGELREGKNICYLSDAGLPCISDPGKKLVTLAIDKGYSYSIIPGPTACDMVYAASQFEDRRFLFVGFLDRNRRKKELETLKLLPYPLVFYEAPHRIRATLEDVLATLGDRRISLGREMTKLHESFIHGSLKTLLEHDEIRNPRGEYAFVVEGHREEEPKIDPEEARRSIIERALSMKEKGLKSSEIAKTLKQDGIISRAELYALLSGE